MSGGGNSVSVPAATNALLERIPFHTNAFAFNGLAATFDGRVDRIQHVVFGKSSNTIVIRLFPTSSRNEALERIIGACPIVSGITERHRKDATIHQDAPGVLGNPLPAGIISSHKSGIVWRNIELAVVFIDAAAAMIPLVFVGPVEEIIVTSVRIVTQSLDGIVHLSCS